MIEIVMSSVTDAKGLDKLVDEVAAEGRYLSGDSGFGEEATKGFIENCIRAGYPQLLLKDDTDIIGWCDIIPDSCKGHGRMGIGVKKEYRGQGYGKKLLLETIRRGFLVFDVIELAVRADNERAIALYESIGFKKYRRLRPMELAAPSKNPVIHMRLKKRWCN